MAETSFYGSDSYCLTDVGLVDVQVTDPRQLIGQRIARILQMPRGALASVGGNPNIGYDTKALLHKKLTPGDIALEQAAIAAECLKDEQVETATVTMSLVGDALSIAVDLTSSEGPFSFVMNVSDLTTEIAFAFKDGAQ